MRSIVVEGARLRTNRHDESKHRVQVLQYITSRNAHDAKALTPEQCNTRSIGPRPIAVTVTIAVDFDDHALVETGKIHRHVTDRKLSAELQPVRALAQRLPEQHLRQAHLAPQLACTLSPV